MWGFACLAFDMGLGIKTADFADVVLKARAVLAQVVPQPGEMRPVLCAEGPGMTSGQRCHTDQVVCEVMWIPPTSVWILGCMSDRS